MLYLVVCVLLRLLLWIRLENLDDLATAVVADRLAVLVLLRPSRALGIVRLQPLLKLRGSHVDHLVELLDDIFAVLHICGELGSASIAVVCFDWCSFKNRENWDCAAR